ncbi:MAG: DNA pilot protein [Microviridae sp.]|nr:MAG: DNA pilot protein [Microviridae sp.]
MPFPVAAAISAGATLAGTGINALQTGNLNRKNRAFTEYMYQKQVQTNRDFWDAQNHYNSPEAVMNRNREAGLNPNFGLVDGQGGAPAGSIASPDTGNFKYESPNSGAGIAEAGSKIAQYQMFERNKLVNEGLELDNANKATQNELYNQDLIIKQFNSQIRGIDFANYETMKKGQMDALDISNKQGRANLTYTFNEEQRRAAMNTSNLKEAVERVLTLEVGRDEARQRIQNLKKDEEIKKMELEMRNLGVQPGSQDWIYAVGMFIRHLMGN